jgi:hypothetical protein
MTTYGLNTESNISTIVTAIYDAAMLTARENNVMTNLVTVYNDRTGLATRSSVKYGQLVMNAVTETDDLASQVFTPSVDQTLTPTEAGGNIFLTDSRIESDPNGVIADASRELGMATAYKIDTDLAGCFNAMTAGTFGASGSSFAWSYFFAMMTCLKRAYAPRPWYWVGTAAMYHNLGKAASIGATVTNDPVMQEKFGSNFYQGSYGGVALFVSENCETSTNDAYCGMFSSEAIALDMRRAPRLERERKATKRGWDLVMSTLYGKGVWHPEYGCYGTFLNTAPTGTT